MIALIAESKTMLSPTAVADEETLKSHIPVFEEDASEIMEKVKQKSVEELTNVLKVTPTLAQKSIKLAYDFPLKSTSDEAINLYTGEVFRALEFHTLPEEAKERFYEEVRIISSLYGWLKPDDMIKPYRLEFKAPLSPDNDSLSKYWKKKVTIAMGKFLKEHGNDIIMNLLPGDAANCIDWKLIKAFGKVIKPDFLVLSKEGDLRKPYTGELKAARGKFLREVLTNDLNLNNLHEFKNDMFLYSEEHSKPGLPVFIQAQP